MPCLSMSWQLRESLQDSSMGGTMATLKIHWYNHLNWFSIYFGSWTLGYETRTLVDTNIRSPTTKLYWEQHISRTWLVLLSSSLFNVFCKQVYWIQEHVFIRVWHSTKLGILLYVIFAEILFWAVIAGILHQLGIYWKLWTFKIMNGHAVFYLLIAECGLV